MLKILLAMTMMSFGALASGELDDETGVINAEAELNGTVVIRVNTETNEVERAVVNEDLGEQAFSGEFSPVEETNISSELDQDAGQSSWYYYWPNRYYGGYYYYYGSYYRPYYSYRYGYYQYYYYNRWNRWY